MIPTEKQARQMFDELIATHGEWVKEWMIMGYDEGKVQLKHSITREYIQVKLTKQYSV